MSFQTCKYKYKYDCHKLYFHLANMQMQMQMYNCAKLLLMLGLCKCTCKCTTIQQKLYFWKALGTIVINYISNCHKLYFHLANMQMKLYANVQLCKTYAGSFCHFVKCCICVFVNLCICILDLCNFVIFH